MSPPVAAVVVVSVVATVVVAYAVKEASGLFLRGILLHRVSVKAKGWWHARKRASGTAPVEVAAAPPPRRHALSDTSNAHTLGDRENHATSSALERLIDSVLDSNQVRERKNRRNDDASTSTGVEMMELDKSNLPIPQIPLTPLSSAGNAVTALVQQPPSILPNPFADPNPESTKAPDSVLHGSTPTPPIGELSNDLLSFPSPGVSRQFTDTSPSTNARHPTLSHASSPHPQVFALSPNMDLSSPPPYNYLGPSFNMHNGALGVFESSPNAWSEASVSAFSWTDGEVAPSESGESHLAFSIGSGSFDDLGIEDIRNAHTHMNENVSEASSPSHHSVSDLEPRGGGPLSISDWESVGSPSASEDGRAKLR
ncbi:uncharacterized protein EI90DRAFT_3159446 [Cantharellus anzutake]|uniref:uncharacterized protein n=1 Tax=Cantharellus anzutake TaxID=1750568 RepID=UPI0019083A34|nr:uncharacterized protein EI90DRAFT_3159446 [Cantharellus anzutake]KAF8314582.1 hypothetical protein EI90DRAFT_3159446 [Cantharellus anzutake]